MNPREKRLLFVLIAVVGVGGVALGTYLWFVKPLMAYNKTILTLSDDRDLEQLKLDTFELERKKLVWARLKSLPIKPEHASSEYRNYLERMIQQTKLKLEFIRPAKEVKVKPTSQFPTVKDVGHLLIAFNLSASGKLADLVKFMELLQSTPYEHRIKGMSIDRADNSYSKNASETLKMNMTIETLLVAKNENMPGHPPGVDPKYRVYDYIAGRSGLAPMGWGIIGSMVAVKKASPMPDNRKYADIARKNIFVGYIPGLGPEDSKDKYPGNIPEYIKLVQTVPTSKEAYLLNLFSRIEEMKVSADPKTGFQERRIQDDKREYVFFDMKVLRVDSGMVYFQVRNQVYSITLGQSLADAVQYPLSIERMDDLDIDWDREWAEKHMKGEDKSAKQKKKGFKK